MRLSAIKERPGMHDDASVRLGSKSYNPEYTKKRVVNLALCGGQVAHRIHPGFACR